MKLIIGCPIYKREWIFPYWAMAIERQSIPLNDVGFIFVASSSDQGTISMINRWKEVSKNSIGFVALQDIGLGLCGDWLNGGRVEGAWLSGFNLALALKKI